MANVRFFLSLSIYQIVGCVCQTGKQTLCNGVSTPVSVQTFTTPPNRRAISPENTFHNIHSVSTSNITSYVYVMPQDLICIKCLFGQVFNVASLPISKSSEMKSDESGFSESMHLSYATAKTQSYSTASTQTPPELNLPEDDLQIGNALINV